MATNAASIHSYLAAPVPQLALTRLDTEQLNVWSTARAKVDNLVLAAGTVLDAIKQDRTLSPDGQAAKMKGEADRILPSFAFLGRLIQDAHNAIATRTRTMLDPITKKPTGNEVVVYMREADVRDLVGRDDATAVFIKSFETDDLETARALLDPPGGAWIAPDIRHRGEEAFAKRTAPDLYAQRQSLTLLLDQLGAMAAMVSDWLIGLGTEQKAVNQVLNQPSA